MLIQSVAMALAVYLAVMVLWGRSADLGHSRGGGGAWPTRGHIHAVVRTPNGNDYGKDLLRQHHEAHAHDPGHGHRQPLGIRVARHRTQRLNGT